MADFFRGVRNANARGGGWSHGKHTKHTKHTAAAAAANRNNNHYSHSSSSARAAAGAAARESGKQFADDLQMKFGVMWADKWSSMFSPASMKTSEKPHSNYGYGYGHASSHSDSYSSHRQRMAAAAAQRRKQEQEQQEQQRDRTRRQKAKRASAGQQRQGEQGEQQEEKGAASSQSSSAAVRLHAAKVSGLQAELKDLQILHQDGALTDSEYAEAKALIMDAIKAATTAAAAAAAAAARSPRERPSSSSSVGGGGGGGGGGVQMDPFIAAEMARGRLRQMHSSRAALAKEGLGAMQEGASQGQPLMCVAAAKAGRDDIVRMALTYWRQRQQQQQQQGECAVVCAEMFAASLRQRPAELGIAELLLEEGVVTTHGGPQGGLLPSLGKATATATAASLAGGGGGGQQRQRQRGYEIDVVVSDPRGGGRVVSRSLGDRVTALHLVVAAAAADPQPTRTARRLIRLLETLLDPAGPYAARPNAPTTPAQQVQGGQQGRRHLPLAICAWNGDNGVKAAKVLLQYGAVATTEILLQAEGWSMRRLLLQYGAELPVKKKNKKKVAGAGQSQSTMLWHDDRARPEWMKPFYDAFDDNY